MAYNITPTLSVPNPTRLELQDVEESRTDRSDPSTVNALRVLVDLKSNNASNRLYGSYVLNVRDGVSDLLRLRNPWTAGDVLQNILEVVVNGVSTPTGMTDCLAAWRSGSAGGRRNNLLTALKNAGILEQASIPGTVGAPT